MWIYGVKALNEDHGVSGGRITGILAQYVHYYHLHFIIGVNNSAVLCIQCMHLTLLFGLFQRNFESYYDEGPLMNINHLILTLPGNLLGASNHNA